MNFFGINLFLDSMDNLIENIFKEIDTNNKRAYYAINPDCMLIAKSDKKYYEILKDTKNQVYVDGKWIINTQKILSLPKAKERIATTDLFPRILELAEESNREVRVFLLGGKKGTADKVIFNMKQKFKMVKFTGCYHGYFNKNKSDEVIDIINESKTEILFVGFGCPIQEKWVDENIDKINANIIITCGGLFDYYSGNVKRAPKWMQEQGMEWLFRLLQEPKRLYKRYILGNLRYISFLLYLKLKGEAYHEYELNKDKLLI